MSRKQITGTRSEIETLIAEEEAASGYPIRGRLVDSTSQPGWETAWARPEPHPTRRNLFAMPVRDAEHRRRLLGKRLGLRTIRAADVVNRDSTWQREDPEA